MAYVFNFLEIYASAVLLRPPNIRENGDFFFSLVCAIAG